MREVGVLFQNDMDEQGGFGIHDVSTPDGGLFVLVGIGINGEVDALGLWEVSYPPCLGISNVGLLRYG